MSLADIMNEPALSDEVRRFMKNRDCCHICYSSWCMMNNEKVDPEKRRKMYLKFMEALPK